MMNGDPVAADGNRHPANSDSDRCNFFDEFYILIMLTAKVAKYIMVGQINIFCYESLFFFHEKVIILLRTISVALKYLKKDTAPLIRCINPGNIFKILGNLLMSLFTSNDQNDCLRRGKILCRLFPDIFCLNLSDFRTVCREKIVG
jgi:hypothetical protein